MELILTASLGIASHIIVTIEASDDAHGVFEFSAESLSVNGTEPEDGDSNIVLQVRKFWVSYCCAVLFYSVLTECFVSPWPTSF